MTIQAVDAFAFLSQCWIIFRDDGFADESKQLSWGVLVILTVFYTLLFWGLCCSWSQIFHWWQWALRRGLENWFKAGSQAFWVAFWDTPTLSIQFPWRFTSLSVQWHICLADSSCLRLRAASLIQWLMFRGISFLLVCRRWQMILHCFVCEK